MFSDTHDLTRINSYRLFIGALGAIFATLLAALFSTTMSGEVLFLVLSSIVGALILLFYGIFVFSVTETAPVLTASTANLSLDKGDEVDEIDEVFSLTDWISTAIQLFSRKPSLIMFLSHFFLWFYTISVHAALPAYFRDYLKQDAGLAGGITESKMAVLIFQSGSGFGQIPMALFPKFFFPELSILIALPTCAISSFGFLFLFENPNVPTWLAYCNCFLGGLGLGILSTCYEVQVPETILWEQSRAAHAKIAPCPTTGIRTWGSADSVSSAPLNENMVYGIVDSMRELAIALSFFVIGYIFDHYPIGTAVRICCGIIPVSICLFCTILFAVFPKIKLVYFS
jgi:hypothetical protein